MPPGCRSPTTSGFRSCLLGPEAIAELLQDLLGKDPLLAGLANRIRKRTGGNPFFIEETVQALAESGSLVGPRGAYRLVRPVAELTLPATVAMLAARIDRLGEREKHLLQTAAVIGKEFTEPVLLRVASSRTSPPRSPSLSALSSSTRRRSIRSWSAPSSTHSHRNWPTIRS